jgi:hypothetical protein
MAQHKAAIVPIRNATRRRRRDPLDSIAMPLSMDASTVSINAERDLDSGEA